MVADAVVARVFLPLAAPGLGSSGIGLVAVARGTYDTIEIAAILVGLLVVAVAGVFTIRSNVAKIWREQAEGEKARVEALTRELADAVKEHAAELAAQRLELAEEVTTIRAEAAEQRELKHQALNELAAAKMRTDLTSLMKAQAEQHAELLGRFDTLTVSLGGERRGGQGA